MSRAQGFSLARNTCGLKFRKTNAVSTEDLLNLCHNFYIYFLPPL